MKSIDRCLEERWIEDEEAKANAKAAFKLWLIAKREQIGLDNELDIVTARGLLNELVGGLEEAAI